MSNPRRISLANWLCRSIASFFNRDLISIARRWYEPRFVRTEVLETRARLSAGDLDLTFGNVGKVQYLPTPMSVNAFLKGTTVMPRLKIQVMCLLSTFLVLAAGPVNFAQAGAMLTPEASAEGFELTTFVSGFDQHFSDIGNVGSGGLGPLGIAFAGDGVIISDGDGFIRSLATRTDGQTIPAVTTSTPSFGFAGATGLAELNGQYYVGGYFQNPGLLKISSTGDYQSNVSTNRIRSLAVDSVHNSLYAAGSGIFRYDPTTNQYVSLASLIPELNTEVDGIATDGTILYATSSFTGNDWESIRGYRLSDGVKVFDSGRIDGVDGAALGLGSLAGKLYANTNFGELYEVDLLNPSQKKLIFTGGTRGDFVTVDPFDGSLLVTQSTEILRLTAPPGGSFTAAVPEPSSLVILASGAGWLGLRRIRSRSKASAQALKQ